MEAGYFSVENMTSVSPPGPEHEQLTIWARSQGVRINGVGPAKISGSGLGIVAQRRIEVSGLQAQLDLSLS